MTQPLRSIRAKLIESVREYCAEHFLRPYIWVDVDDACLVPFEYVTEGMIILDVDDEAVRGLELTDELLTFEARFGDSVEPMQVVVPLNRIVHAAPAETPPGVFVLILLPVDQLEEFHSQGLGFARGNSW